MNTAISDSGAPIQVERRSSCWLVRLNRPEKRNTLSEEMTGGLLRLMAAVTADPEARALLLWGAGGHFCSGGDITRFVELMNQPLEHGEDPIALHNREFGHLLEALSSLPVPTIAIVRGSAMGGGCGLAAACDRVIAADDAVFAMPEVTLGVAPAQIAPFVMRRAGTTRARWLMATGVRLTADEALLAGLADSVVPAAALTGAVAETLRGLCSVEPGAVRATLRVADRCVRAPLRDVLDEAAREFAGLLRHGSAREGIAAVRERRPPSWNTPLPEVPEFS